MHYSLAAAGGLLLLLGLAACGSSGDGDTDTDAAPPPACEREASPQECADAESLAAELGEHDGVDTVELEFSTIEGEGVYELDLSFTVADDSSAAEVADAIAFALAAGHEVNADRDLGVAVTRSGAVVYLDLEYSPDPQRAADVLVAAGDLSDYGTVEVLATPASIDVRLPEGGTPDDITAVAEEVVAMRLPPSVAVAVIADGVHYLSLRDGIQAGDLDRWRHLAEALDLADGFEVESLTMTDKEVDVSVTLPSGVRRDDFTAQQYGDRFWPMVHAQLDVVAQLPNGASYSLDTNWAQSDAGFDYFLTAIVGPRTDGDPNPRGWDAAAEAYLTAGAESVVTRRRHS